MMPDFADGQIPEQIDGAPGEHDINGSAYPSSSGHGRSLNSPGIYVKVKKLYSKRTTNGITFSERSGKTPSVASD